MFENFISLGWYCGTANSMSKLGIRSHSGPFDWYFSDLSSVIECMANDFIDFLDYKNLSVHSDRADTFEDKKYGFVFPHDIIISLKPEYEEIRKKYFRRIQRFRTDIKKQTCFLRTVRNQEELDYIRGNIEYISYIISKQNKNNRIVFLIPQFLCRSNVLHDNLGYILDIDEFGLGNLEVLRSIFDSNQKFLDFCIGNYELDKRKNNLMFDADTYIENLRKTAFIWRSRYELMYRLSTIDFSSIAVPEKVVIYGAGKVGRFLYERIKNRCTVKYFIDRITYEDSYKDIPVFNLNSEKELIDYEAWIIITPVYDIQKIEKSLDESQFCDMHYISLNELLMKV
ncbi:DUF1796 family putative cysteine peptidase [Lachnospiraceae bacterium 42-17]